MRLFRASGGRNIFYSLGQCLSGKKNLKIILIVIDSCARAGTVPRRAEPRAATSAQIQGLALGAGSRRTHIPREHPRTEDPPVHPDGSQAPPGTDTQTDRQTDRQPRGVQRCWAGTAGPRPAGTSSPHGPFVCWRFKASVIKMFYCS